MVTVVLIKKRPFLIFTDTSAAETGVSSRLYFISETEGWLNSTVSSENGYLSWNKIIIKKPKPLQQDHAVRLFSSWVLWKPVTYFRTVLRSKTSNKNKMSRSNSSVSSKLKLERIFITLFKRKFLLPPKPNVKPLSGNKASAAAAQAFPFLSQLHCANVT